MGRGNRHEELSGALLQPRTAGILGAADPLAQRDNLHHVPRIVVIDNDVQGHEYPSADGMLRVYYQHGKLFVDNLVQAAETFRIPPWSIPETGQLLSHYQEKPTKEILFHMQGNHYIWLKVQAGSNRRYPLEVTCGQTQRNDHIRVLWQEHCTRQVWNSILLDMDAVRDGNLATDFTPIVAGSADNRQA